MGVLFDPTADVFSLEEVARAAGVDEARVRALVRDRQVRTCASQLLACHEAVRAVVLLRAQQGTNPQGLFAPPRGQARRHAVPMLASGSLHVALAVTLALIAATGVSGRIPAVRPEPARLVFIALPGPGGGGGGGGLRIPKPVQKAELKGERRMRSPVVVARREKPKPRETPRETPRVETPPPVPKPVETPLDPAPPPPPPPVPAVTAPVASVPADRDDKAGDLQGTGATQGPGAGGGSGTGNGTGTGEGSGPGIGPGSGGGTGGGPYRPGSGVTPPRLLREVKPDYTEEARRRGLSGEVVLEVIVRRDGTVGSVRVTHGLGGGLDQRAVDAVRQWRFAPGERLGTPVDVVVEVAVEFKLR
jgi:TonB family protein